MNQDTSITLAATQAVESRLSAGERVAGGLSSAEQEVESLISSATGVKVTLAGSQVVEVKLGESDPLPPESAEIVFYDYSVYKNIFFGVVVVSWKTDVASKGKLKWRPRSGGDWTETALGLLSTIHAVTTTMVCTPGAEYEFYAYGELADESFLWDDIKYIKINGAGNPEFEES